MSAKTIYAQELETLKPHDPVQFSSMTKYGLEFITTAGHGYMVVPQEHEYYPQALRLCEYGFSGDIAVYLEEDCEVPKFLSEVGLTG